jgi:F-type H+-transporting ATPase subunit b
LEDVITTREAISVFASSITRRRSCSAAELQAKEIVTKAREAIEQERRRVMDEAKTEIASLVVMTSSKVLGRELNEEERARFSDAASREADFSLN